MHPLRCNKQPRPAWAWARNTKNSSSSSSGHHSNCRRRSGGRAADSLQHYETASGPVTRQQSQKPTSKHLQQQQQSGPPEQFLASSQRASARQLLPEQELFNRIKACTTLAECQELLQQDAARVDAMQISTLITHTVHLHQRQQQTFGAFAPTGGTLWQQPQQRQQPQQQQRQQPQQQHLLQEPQHQLPSSGSSSTSTFGSYQTPPHQQAAGSSSSSSRSTPAVRIRDLSRTALTQYLRQLADVALSLALAGTFRPQQYSNVLWGLARLGHKPQAAWVASYLNEAQQQLARFQPRNLAQLVWAVAALRGQPQDSFVTMFLRESSRSLSGFKPIDLANTLWALAALGIQPPADLMVAAMAATARNWAGFKPYELSIVVWGFAKLGVSFRDPQLWAMQQQQQWGQQQWQQQQQQPPAAGPPAAAASMTSGWLLASVASNMPAMGVQEAANLLWGLAVGNAALSQPQLEAVANQAFIILSQSATRTKAATAALTVSMWSLARLGWTPTLPQARLLIRLLSEALLSGTLDMKHACVLLWSLGALRLRPPAAAMHYLLDSLVSGIQAAGPSEVLQVLTACRRLGWRMSRQWWNNFYCGSVGTLQAASTGHLASMMLALGHLRTIKPDVRPSLKWWEAFWECMGVELEATVRGRGLERISFTRNLPKGRITIAAAHAAAAAAAAKPRGVTAAAAGKAGSAATSAACGSSSDSSGSRWQPERFLHMQEALQIVANLQDVAMPLPSDPRLKHQVVSSRHAVQLLWGCARLKRTPPKALLWQLLLLLLVDVHHLSCSQLTLVLWSTARMIQWHGQKRVQCYTLIKPLALVAQWRLMMGLGSGSNSTERRRFMAALRYLAVEAGLMPFMMGLSSLEGRVAQLMCLGGALGAAGVKSTVG